jgi:DNA (cytosine-5)-methyltransferase 1
MTKKIKVCSLFSGIGGFETGIFKALGEENVEVVFASEIDKFATQSYTTLYGQRPQGDITQILEYDIPDHDLLVAGFPCQSFSLAGKRLGFMEARGTLFFDVARIAKEKQPPKIILENVKGLVSHDKGETLDTIIEILNSIGYTVDFNVLNTKYFDLPQNRERIFIIAIRDDLITPEPWNIIGNNVVAKGKKRISSYGRVKSFNFDFPKQEVVTKRLRDILESNVDERYYLSNEKTESLIKKLDEELPAHFPTENDINKTIRTGGKGSLTAKHNYDHIAEEKPLGIITEGNVNGYQDGLVMNTEGVSKTIVAGNAKKYILENQEIKCVNPRKEDGSQSYQQDRVYCDEGIVPAICAGLADLRVVEEEPKLKTIGNTNPSGRGMNGNVYDAEAGLSPTLTTNKGEGAKIAELQEENEGRMIVKGLMRKSNSQGNRIYDTKGISPTVNTGTEITITEEDSSIITVGYLDMKGHNAIRRVISQDGLSPTIDTMQGGNRQPKVLEEGLPIREATKKGYTMANEGDAVNFKFPDSKTRRGRVGKQLANTLEASSINQGVVTPRYRIRKLTPLECWRLQGFSDEAHNKVRDAGVSSSQLYKQAGNSVSVNVIEELIKKLYGK